MLGLTIDEDCPGVDWGDPVELCKRFISEVNQLFKLDRMPGLVMVFA
jgi:hypothetical protein